MFNKNINLITVIDHSGRAGNGFFLTIFDKHPEVITCHWMHYTYSYIYSFFGENNSISVESIIKKWSSQSYMKYIYQSLNKDLSRVLTKFGGNPKAKIDRAKVRECFNDYLKNKKNITRKELVLLTYYSYAKAIDKNINKIKYILVSDAITLRDEDVLNGYSGRIIKMMKDDFPNVKIMSLVRDTRANFASCRHQFVNQNGNMYGVKLNNLLIRIKELFTNKYHPDNFVYIYWLLCFSQASRTINSVLEKFKDQAIIIKNESLNLDFINSMRKISMWLDIAMIDLWKTKPFVPTSVGEIWTGTGAYNSQYQTAIYGPLKNDPDKVAKKVTGPNKYVTERWKKKLSKNEIILIEKLFYHELTNLNYKFIYLNNYKSISDFSMNFLFFFFQGEIPGFSWIINGFKLNIFEVINRLFYYIEAPLFIICTRIFLKKLVKKDFFHNINSFNYKGCKII